MKYIFTIFVSIILLNTTTYSQVNADFNFTNVCFGAQTNFTDNSTGTIISYDWDFGDGGNDVVQNPTHFYNLPGTYTVTLIVTEAITSDKDTVQKNVSVFPMPIVDAGNDTSILCPGATFSMNATSSGVGLTYSWTPSDGLSATNVLNPIASPMDATTYTLLVTSVDGCVASDIVMIAIPYQMNIFFNTNNVSCFGLSDGNATVNVTGGTPPYTYLWQTLDTSQTVYNLAPNQYSVDVTDYNGCTSSNMMLISEPLNLTISFSNTDETCVGSKDGVAYAYVSGGTYPYSYYWSTGGSTDTESNLNSGTYIVDIIDNNGCALADTTYISSGTSYNQIMGQVTYQSNPITSGTVDFYQKDNNTGTVTLLQNNLPVDGNGYYFFDSYGVGDFLIKATGDTLLYNSAPTFPISTSNWANATLVTTSTCTDTVSMNIALVELSVNSGPGVIFGRLIEGDSIIGVGEKAPGEPIPDIDITVDQSPGGQVMSSTVSDINGYFYIDNLPYGTYTINIDIYGYPTNPQVITINADSTEYEVELCTDSSMIEIDYCQFEITSIAKNMLDDRLKMYPNPAKDVLNIVYSGNDDLTFSIADITGKTVKTQIIRDNFTPINVSEFNKGLYIVRLKNSSTDLVQKLIIE